MLNVAIECAISSGKFLLQNIDKINSIEEKSGEIRNLVTDIDKKSEEIIVKKIKEHFPSHNIIAEEGSSGNNSSDTKWIIDPIDGTTNYLHSLPLFSVSIGIEKNGEIILGVIYEPSRDELFVAEKNCGAKLNGKKISVSKQNQLIRSLLVTGFPYNINENPKNCIQHFNNFLFEAQAVRRLGSAALDLCYVACGRFEGFWEVQLKPWDVAAGKLIVEESGGKISDFDGNNYSIYDESILATNGLVHNDMISVLQKGK